MDKIWLQPCSKLTIQHMTNVLFMCKLTPLTLTFIFSLLHQTHSLSPPFSISPLVWSPPSRSLSPLRRFPNLNLIPSSSFTYYTCHVLNGEFGVRDATHTNKKFI